MSMTKWLYMLVTIFHSRYTRSELRILLLKSVRIHRVNVGALILLMTKKYGTTLLKGTLSLNRQC